MKKIFIFILLFILSKPLWAQEVLSWDDCLRLAALQHPDLLSAKEIIRQSQDTKIISASTLWPQVSSDLSITRTRSNPSIDVSSNSTTYAYGVSGTQLIFDAFKTTNSVKAAKENIKASQWNFQFVSSQVRLRLRTAYINLWKSQELIKLTKDILDIRNQNLDLITKYYNSGIENSGSLLTAQANLAEAKFETNQARRVLEVAQRGLIKEIGVRGIGNIQADSGIMLSATYQQKPDFEAMVNDNPQLLQIIAQTNAAAFEARSGWGNLWPALALVGGAGKSDTRWPPDAGSAQVGLAVTWPLFEGGLRMAQLDQARSVYKGLQYQQQSLKEVIILSLEQTWSDLQDAIEQVDVQKRFLEANQERSRISQKQYSIGLLSFNEWTIIEDNYVGIKKIYLNTQANALLAEANWIASQGRTLEYAN